MRSATVLWVWTAALLATGMAVAQPSAADKEGQSLARELRTQRPAEAFASAGTLRLRDNRGKWREEVPVRMEVRLADRSWQTLYEALDTNALPWETLIVTRADDLPNQYTYLRAAKNSTDEPKPLTLAGNEAAQPFAGSEFWLSDLGLDFLHWPQQRMLRHEMRKGRSCKVLESVNPQPQGGQYARVLSWIDIEHRGILRAEAYDAQRRLIKEFSIGSFKKVDGRWQLKSMEIRNEQTDARTRLEFELEFDERPSPATPAAESR